MFGHTMFGSKVMKKRLDPSSDVKYTGAALTGKPGGMGGMCSCRDVKH